MGGKRKSDERPCARSLVVQLATGGGAALLILCMGSSGWRPQLARRSSCAHPWAFSEGSRSQSFNAFLTPPSGVCT